MERIQPMNELQIQEKVEDLAGKPIRILDCEQNTLNQTEEVFLVNGLPISLSGEEGLKIKRALVQGEILSCDLVNSMLIRAGIENNPVELETTMDVKSSVKTREQSQLINANGILLGENMNQKEDADHVKNFSVGIWITDAPRGTLDIEQMPGPDKSYVQWKPDDEEPTDKKSMSVPSKPMKSHKSTAEQSGLQQQGGHKSGSELVSLHSSVPGQLSDQVPGEESSSCNKIDNLWESLKSPKNKNIFSFLLNRKFNESKKCPANPGHPEVQNSEQGTKSLSKTPPVATDDKHKKNKKQNSSQKSSAVEPKYDHIVHSSAAIMSAHSKFQKTAIPQNKIVDSGSSLMGVEVDTVPERVTHETFV